VIELRHRDLEEIAQRVVGAEHLAPRPATSPRASASRAANVRADLADDVLGARATRGPSSLRCASNVRVDVAQAASPGWCSRSDSNAARHCRTRSLNATCASSRRTSVSADGDRVSARSSGRYVLDRPCSRATGAVRRARADGVGIHDPALHADELALRAQRGVDESIASSPSSHIRSSANAVPTQIEAEDERPAPTGDCRRTGRRDRQARAGRVADERRISSSTPSG
jgi:hypothetical protein